MNQTYNSVVDTLSGETWQNIEIFSLTASSIGDVVLQTIKYTKSIDYFSRNIHMKTI